MGCGPGKIGDWLVRDTLLGVKWELCCDEHDAAYLEQTTTRKEADREFLKCMVSEARSEFFPDRPVLLRLSMAFARVYYWAVRMGGWVAWRRSRRN